MCVMSSYVSEELESYLENINPANFSLMVPREYEAVTGNILDEISYEDNEQKIFRTVSTLMCEMYGIRIPKAQCKDITSKIMNLLDNSKKLA